MRIKAFQINPSVDNFRHNIECITSCIQESQNLTDTLMVFPELALTGYPPTDSMLAPSYAKLLQESMDTLLEKNSNASFLFGSVIVKEGKLHNGAIWAENGFIKKRFYKQLLPNYDVFDERRYFATFSPPSSDNSILHFQNHKIGVLICEDMWHAAYENTAQAYEIDPLAELAKTPLDLLINISASPFDTQKLHRRLQLAHNAQKVLNSPVLYVNSFGGNDDLIFDGQSFWINDEETHVAKAFEADELEVELKQDARLLSAQSSIPKHQNSIKQDISFLALALEKGVQDYFSKTGAASSIVGLSGGIDSAVVAAISAGALGAANTQLVYMPSPYSSTMSTQDAQDMAQRLGCPFTVLPIESLMAAFEDVLEETFENREADLTEENIQSRIRGTLLMALSNKMGGLVLNTGNKSEFAMGYTTQYGDLIGAISPLGDLYKHQVYALAEHYNKNKSMIPSRIIQRPPSAELRENQKDSDSLPDYAILDDILEKHLEKHWMLADFKKQEWHDLALVSEVLRSVERNEYKRKQAPPILKVSPLAFGRGRRMNIAKGPGQKFK